MLNLHHPNIVRILDFVEEQDGMHLVMEMIEGISIDQYILKKTGPIPEDQAISLFGQILEGMQYAHDRGIIHRDIKPSNFMVTPQRIVKILDFGIAKIGDGKGNQHTKTGARMGTVYYMSPEQVNGHQLDHRSDIYSLGVTLFQMLTGQSPYPNSTTEYEVYQKILNEKLPKAATIYPGVSARMQAIIEKATQKRMQDRFQDCNEFYQALFPPQNPSAAKVADKPRKVPNSAPKRRWKIWLWLVPSLVIFTGLGIGLFFIYNPPTKTIVLPAETPKEIALNFLNAIEMGDSVTAIKYATNDCKKEIKLYFMVAQSPKHRKVTILDSEGSGHGISINYRLSDSYTSKHIELEPYEHSWRVKCLKTEMISKIE
jgi:serine/threonine protein kinase